MARARARCPIPMRDQGAIFAVGGALVDAPHEQAWRAALDRLMACASPPSL